MSSARAFSLTSRLAFTTATLMFGLIVIGSVVRTTGSGLACPDWPLCQGQLIPPMQFNVLIEWFHRLVALGVSVLLIATCATVVYHRDVRASLGGVAVLAVILLVAQVVLGALTVWKLLSPAIVSSHLAVALLLFATLITLGLAARRSSMPAIEPHPRPAGLLPLLMAGTLLVYGQALLGGMVSTSGAGLACPDWPACNGEWFPPLAGPQGLQMLHRWGAYVLTAVMLLVALRSRAATDPLVRAAAPLPFAMVVGQATLGVLNVLLGTPVWLVAFHLANAAAILAMMVLLTFRVATQPAAEPAFVAVEAR